MNVKKAFAYCLSILIFFLFWIFLARIIDSPLILSKPKEVFLSFIELIKTNVLFEALGQTFKRVFISFIISSFLGIIIGSLSGEFIFVKDFIKFPLSLLRATPVISIILLALFWFKSTQLPIFVSILMTLPIIITGVENGLTKTDIKLLQMANVFEINKFKTFIFIKIPNSIPYLLTALVSSFGLTWKVVVAGEVLCIPKNGLGTLLQKYSLHLETANVMVITLILIFVNYLLERLFSFIVGKITNEAS